MPNKDMDEFVTLIDQVEAQAKAAAEATRIQVESARKLVERLCAACPLTPWTPLDTRELAGSNLALTSIRIFGQEQVVLINEIDNDTIAFFNGKLAEVSCELVEAYFYYPTGWRCRFFHGGRVTSDDWLVFSGWIRDNTSFLISFFAQIITTKNPDST